MTDVPKLHKMSVLCDVRLERNLGKWLKLFAEYENDDSLSNSPDEVYHANTVKAGLEGEF